MKYIWNKGKHDGQYIDIGRFGQISISGELLDEEDRPRWYNFMLHDQYGNEQEWFSGGASTLEECKDYVEKELTKILSRCITHHE